MNTNKIKQLCCMTVLFLCLSFTSCVKKDPLPIAPSEFTKNQREEIGSLLQNTIALDHEYFQFLPKSPPYDTTVYWLVQRLYDQATNVMRIDHQAASDNHWTKDQTWPVHILISEEKNAFVLPGGYFYITTGLLKSLKEEYELYYLLSFEANLMNEGLLLETLVSEVNSNELTALIHSSPRAEESKAVARILSTLELNPSVVYENDEITTNTICNTSRWNRLGILPMLENYDDNMEWLTYRPSYDERAELILGMNLDFPEDCGNLNTNNPSNEGYQHYVLDVLN